MTGGEIARGPGVTANHATMFFTASPRPDVADAVAAAALARASAYLAELPPIAAGGSGYRLFWVRGDEIGHKDLGPADHAIVGRHSACDVPLAGAAELSLRHLLVATTRLGDGAVGLRVLDLRASLPFYTDDGQPRRAIVASGPLVLRLGSYLFGGVPIEPTSTRPVLPAELPRAVITSAPPPRPAEGRSGPIASPAELSTIVHEDELFEPAPLTAASSPSAPAAPSALEAGVLASALLSRVTVVAPTALLTEMATPGLASDASFARLTLLREGHAASLDLPTADLEAGVLIGRSERCTDGGLRRVLDGNISRIHVLLLRDGDDMIVFDLCSTQGTYANGESIRRHVLESAGGCLSLAKTNPVMLCFHPRTVTGTTPSGRDGLADGSRDTPAGVSAARQPPP